jgi:hypothetical protein
MDDRRPLRLRLQLDVQMIPDAMRTFFPKSEEVDQAHVAINEVRKAPQNWQARIDHQDEKIKNCEEEVPKTKKVLDDAVEQWKTINRIWDPSDDSDLLSLKATLKVQGDEIASLTQEICSLEEICRSKKQIIRSLKTRIAKDEPLLKVGLDILRRKQEMGKPKAESDMAAVECGNKAAHFGSALADASRVLSGSVAKDQTWYFEAYGFPAYSVLDHGPTAPTFVEVVDWHAAVKNFQNNVMCDPSNKFIAQFKIFKDDWSSCIETYLTEDQQGKKHYKSLKLWYEAAYTMHKQRRASR